MKLVENTRHSAAYADPEELEKGGYEVLEYKGFENSAQDSLLLSLSIVNLDVTAPDTMSP